MKLILVAAFLPVVSSLTCYSGFTYVKEVQHPTGEETCQAGESCYNASVTGNGVIGVKKAGCGGKQCLLVDNGCYSRNLFGHEIKFCCCNSLDHCNGPNRNMSIMSRVGETLKSGIMDKLFSVIG